MTPLDELPFAVRLTALHGELELARPRVDATLEVGDRETAVHLRVAPAEHIQVDAVEDDDAHEGGMLVVWLVRAARFPGCQHQAGSRRRPPSRLVCLDKDVGGFLRSVMTGRRPRSPYLPDHSGDQCVELTANVFSGDGDVPFGRS